MFGLSIEHMMIMGVVLLFFGPRRLPELGKTLGQGIRNFKSSLSAVHEGETRQTGDSPAAPRAIDAAPAAGGNLPS
jgi:sec-independent protein translocase protein TatA